MMRCVRWPGTWTQPTWMSCLVPPPDDLTRLLPAATPGRHKGWPSRSASSPRPGCSSCSFASWTGWVGADRSCSWSRMRTWRIARPGAAGSSSSAWHRRERLLAVATYRSDEFPPSIPCGRPWPNWTGAGAWSISSWPDSTGRVDCPGRYILGHSAPSGDAAAHLHPVIGELRCSGFGGGPRLRNSGGSDALLRQRMAEPARLILRRLPPSRSSAGSPATWSSLGRRRPVQDGAVVSSRTRHLPYSWRSPVPHLWSLTSYGRRFPPAGRAG